MPSKRDVIAHLSRDELIASADQFDLAVVDRRVRDQLVDAVASSKKAGLADIVARFPRVLEAMTSGRMEVVCFDGKNEKGQLGSDSQLADSA